MESSKGFFVGSFVHFTNIYQEFTVASARMPIQKGEGMGKYPVTPLKFNMEPEKKSLAKEIPFGNHHFQVPC